MVIFCFLSGMTALHDACYYGFEDIADLLIRKGANVNCFDKDGQTPLHVSCILSSWKFYFPYATFFCFFYFFLLTKFSEKNPVKQINRKLWPKPERILVSWLVDTVSCKYFPLLVWFVFAPTQLHPFVENSCLACSSKSI